MPGCGAAPSYIPTLYSNYNNAWPPTTLYAAQGAYGGNGYGGTLSALTDGMALGPVGGLGTFRCTQTNQPTGQFYVPPKNWYISCPDTGGQPGFQASTKAIFGGGQLIFQGGIGVNGSACLAINTPMVSLPVTPDLLTCPTASNITSEQATTSPAPTQEALVFVRGSRGFTTGSNSTTILLPQTFLAQANNGPLSIGGGGGLLLWTSPGAGTLTGTTSTLDSLCTADTSTVTTCHDSRFAKVAYWNEATSAGSGPTMDLKGQGGLGLVGTFFAPRMDFTFSGQGSYYATSAQFWINTLTLSGQTGLGMTPDAAVSFDRLDYGVALIR
jgi:hypothetical protein